MVKPKVIRRFSDSAFQMVYCVICGVEVLRSKAIRHHTNPFRKTKDPGALSKLDLREKMDLIWVCRKCHGQIHKKLQKSEFYTDEYGKKRVRRPYITDDTEGAIWRH